MAVAMATLRLSALLGKVEKLGMSSGWLTRARRSFEMPLPSFPMMMMPVSVSVC